MKKLVAMICNNSSSIAVLLMLAGLVVYATALGIAVFFEGDQAHKLSGWFQQYQAANVGIPCSAIAAFAIVASLLRAFPPKQEDGAISVKTFGLEFSGPSGPVTLWLLCFLSFIFAIHLLR